MTFLGGRPGRLTGTLRQRKTPLTSCFADQRVEAASGIEPLYGVSPSGRIATSISMMRTTLSTAYLQTLTTGSSNGAKPKSLLEQLRTITLRA